MGCSSGDGQCFRDEQPVHEVNIGKGFWLGQTQVTQLAYERVTGKHPSHFTGSNLPVEEVGWNDARAYCQAVGGRLPTEAEWEYAARAGSARARYGELGQIAWYSENSGNKTHEVAQKQANAWGVFDVLGNVWEWMADWYGDYAPSEAHDPKGSDSGPGRTLRGGSWNDGSGYARVSARSLGVPTYRGSTIGFRCVGE